MDQLNLKQLEQIPIPEGLSERLSAKIDEWEQQELQQQHARQHAKQRKLYPSMWRITAVAACMALVFGVGYHKTPTRIPSRHNRRPSEHSHCWLST